MKLFLFFTGLLIPFVMIGAGWFMHKYPPKNINWVIGYRTGRSMRNPDTWMFAQKKIGMLWEKAGVISLIASAAVQIPFLFLSVEALSVAMLVSMSAQLAALLLTILPVERALQREFPDEKEKKS